LSALQNSQDDKAAEQKEENVDMEIEQPPKVEKEAE